MARPLLWDRCPWGLGPELKGAKAPHWSPPGASLGSFGHAGASGAIAWADPEEELAVVLLTNQAWASRWPVRDRRLARLADAIMAALD